MTNYDKIQKASTDKLIDILCNIKCDPCDGCVLGCKPHLRDRIEKYLKCDYDCNTSHSVLSSCDVVDRLKKLKLKYLNTLKSMSEISCCSDVVATYHSLDYAISLLEDLDLEF